MSGADAEAVRALALDPEAVGFAHVVERMERRASAGCAALAHYVRDGHVRFVVNPGDALPLPSRLDTPEIVSECRRMEREHFAETEGAALYDYLAGEGYMILSWPDGTRVAVRAEGDAQPSAFEAQLCYTAARFYREACLSQVAGQGGESPCLIH